MHLNLAAERKMLTAAVVVLCLAIQTQSLAARPVATSEFMSLRLSRSAKNTKLRRNRDQDPSTCRAPSDPESGHSLNVMITMNYSLSTDIHATQHTLYLQALRCSDWNVHKLFQPMKNEC